jgi:predicted TPR repeat methyltransferase
VRETYYLAREYWYRKDYTTAAKWYADYLTRATWAPEIADAWLMSARCLWYMQNGDLARDACLQAIKINANFKEAELFMAEMSGPKNSARWKQIAETADNSDVLFVRTSSKEKDSKFYDKLFAEHRDLSRYHAIYQSISAAAENCRVLDIGCGIALLAGYVPWYAGFDFAEQTIAKARAAGRNVWVGNALEKCNYREADLYVATEVLEHIDRDVDVIHNIPSGKRVIFTVPSFDCEGHVRTYDEAKVINLYARLLDIHRISRFVWRNDAWVQSTHKTEPYILLVEAVRR